MKSCFFLSVLWLAVLVPATHGAQTNLFLPGETVHIEFPTGAPLARVQTIASNYVVIEANAMTQPFRVTRDSIAVGTNSCRIGFTTSATPGTTWYITAIAMGENNTRLTFSSVQSDRTISSPPDSDVFHFFLKLMGRLSGC